MKEQLLPPLPKPNQLTTTQSVETTTTTTTTQRNHENGNSSCNSNSTSHTTTNNNETNDSSRNTEVSNYRTSLRQSISQTHLSKTEQEYLYQLCDVGNELEVQLAHDSLLNTDVFFPITETIDIKSMHSQAPMLNESEATSRGWASDIIQLNYNDEDGDDDDDDEKQDNDISKFRHSTGSMMPTTTTTTTTTSQQKVVVGSDRRLNRLQERRSSIAIHLWKAHESGLGISKQSSRRSLLSRSQSARQLFQQQRRSSSSNSSLSSSHLKQPNSDCDIFRSNNRVSLIQQQQKQQQQQNVQPSIDTTAASDGIVPVVVPARNRRISWHSETVPIVLEKQIPAVPKVRPIVRRRRSESEGSRKSVTFHKDVIQSLHSAALTQPPSSTVGHNSIPPMLLPRRTSSAGSIPSLHYGTPILSSSPSSSASTTAAMSISSIPSIRMAQSIRSTSAASLLSDITDGYYSIDDEEKKVPDDNTNDANELKNASELRESKWKSKIIADCNANIKSDAVLQESVKLLSTNDPAAPLQLAGYTAAPSTSSDRLDVLSQQQQLPHEATVPPPPNWHVMMRKASMNAYNGEGIEVTDVLSADDSEMFLPAMADSLTIKSSNSFDDHALQINSNRASLSRGIFRRLMIRRTLSDESVGLFRAKPLLGDNSNSIVTDIDDSWNTSKVNADDFDNDNDVDDDDDDDDYYDSWKVVEDEYENGYGGGGTLPFLILGTSADDVDSHPHVLSPPLLESLQSFVPLEKSNDNFWMKYSMVRDGNTLYSFLQRARGSKHTILAIETVDGEVFGAFTAEPWRKSWNYFGNGESFLWRMRHSRHEKCHSIIDQAHMESEIDVYPFIGMNNCVQFCSQDKIAVGGGTYVTSPSFSDHSELIGEGTSSIQDRYKAHEWGFGLTIEGDFLHGTSSPCLTFGSPSLSALHSDGSLFEIMNIELWTLTPCNRVEDAEKLELGKLFLENNKN